MGEQKESEGADSTTGRPDPDVGGTTYFTTLLPLSPTVNTRSTYGQHTVNTRSTYGQHEAKMSRKPSAFLYFSKFCPLKILIYI